jgi:hypothetical protein
MASELESAVECGDLPQVQRLLREGVATIADANVRGRTALLHAAHRGHLTMLQWLLAEGGASIRETNIYGRTALLLAAHSGHLAMLQWLLAEGGASITEMDNHGNTVLLCAASGGKHLTTRWLLEHGGADITEAGNDGRTVWDILAARYDKDWDDGDTTAAITALLRVMVLRGAPPAKLKNLLWPADTLVVQEGSLRARLPAYLARQRALLDEHCPLIAPLRAIISGYDVPTTTEELWATGFGAVTRQAPSAFSPAPLRSPVPATGVMATVFVEIFKRHARQFAI